MKEKEKERKGKERKGKKRKEKNRRKKKRKQPPYRYLFVFLLLQCLNLFFQVWELHAVLLRFKVHIWNRLVYHLERRGQKERGKVKRWVAGEGREGAYHFLVSQPHLLASRSQHAAPPVFPIWDEGCEKKNGDREWCAGEDRKKGGRNGGIRRTRGEMQGYIAWRIAGGIAGESQGNRRRDRMGVAGEEGLRKAGEEGIAKDGQYGWGGERVKEEKERENIPLLMCKQTFQFSKPWKEGEQGRIDTKLATKKDKGERMNERDKKEEERKRKGWEVHTSMYVQHQSLHRVCTSSLVSSKQMQTVNLMNS